jgi:Spt4/RpoE2 zinc finger
MSDEGEEEVEEGEGEGQREETPQQLLELMEAPVPNALRGIRACKRCGLLKTIDQFLNHGCENCPFLDMVRTEQNGSMRKKAVLEPTAYPSNL